MKKTVITYLKGIPAKNTNKEKEEVLKRFADGVNKLGDIGIASTQDVWSASDLGVIQGFVHQDSPNSPHLKLRKSVVDNQKAYGKSSLIIDSNLFLYADPGNRKHYLRYSANGVFPTTGNYFWDTPDPSRWQSISANLNISLKDWRTQGDHILICLQRNGGWSMQGLDVMQWCKNIISTLKKHTDRPIVVRAHPGDKRAKQYLKLNYPKVRISYLPSIKDDLKNCWAVVTYNSSPGVAAAIEGYPVFVLDPNPQISQAYEVANTTLKRIENPKMPERQQWIEKISMSHWNFEELSSGSAWEHIRKYV
jgi:hypothetical protein